MIEPAYDPQRLQTDQAYQHSLIDDFTAYMEQLPDFAEQVRYYMRICEAMARRPLMLNIGCTIIFERECYSGYGEGKPIDREGNALTGKRWGLPAYDNNQQHNAIRNRLYFTDFYKYRSGSLFGFEIKPLCNLTANYLQKVANHRHPEAFRQSELNTIGRTIEKYQAAVTKWATDLQVVEEMRHQFRQASELVQDELNGANAIEWGQFYRAYHLNPFALLWDITAYKLFLEQPQQRQDLPTIHILPNARPALVEALLPYCPEEQHRDLKALINGAVQPDRVITCQCEQVAIGKIFYERVKDDNNRLIVGDKTKIADWICRNFVRVEDGTIKSLTTSTMLNHLKGKGFAYYR